MTRDESVVELRREMDRNLRERLLSIEERIAEHEVNLAREQGDIKLTLQRIVQWQTQYEETLCEVSRLLATGTAFRLIMVYIVGALGLIGATATAYEAVKRWLS